MMRMVLGVVVVVFVAGGCGGEGTLFEGEGSGAAKLLTGVHQCCSSEFPPICYDIEGSEWECGGQFWCGESHFDCLFQASGCLNLFDSCYKSCSTTGCEEDCAQTLLNCSDACLECKFSGP